MKVKECLNCSFNRLSYVAERSDQTKIIRCNKCRLMMVEILNDNLDNLYNDSYFEKNENTGVGYQDYFSKPALNMIGKYAFARLAVNNFGKHLDLGCASGLLMDIFVSNGFKSYGLEISKQAVEICANKGLNVIVSNLHSFPEKYDSFDIITGYDVLEHVDRPGTVVSNIAKSLSKNGVFVFTTLAVTEYNNEDYWFNNSLEHFIYYDQESLSNILEEHFGAGNFFFKKVTINGVAEFWGYAFKKRSKQIQLIEDYFLNQGDIKDLTDNYHLSLYLCQISRFEDAKKIIKSNEKHWNINQVILSNFSYNYLQGHFDQALKFIDGYRYFISSDSLLWHAVYDCESKMREIDKFVLNHESSKQIIDLRDKILDIKSSKSYVLSTKIASTFSFLKRLPKLPYRILKKIIKSTVLPSLSKMKRTTKSLLPKKKEKKYRVINQIKWESNTPLIAVVIPFYNRHKTIDQTINSLRLQTFKNFEVILVDDGSSEENSKKKIVQLKKDPFINKVIIQKNKGVASARNNGIKNSKAKYIVCLDSDDLIEPTYLEKCALLLETHPDISIVSTYMTIFIENKLTFNRDNPFSDSISILINNNTVKVDSIDKEKKYKHSDYSSLRLIEDNMLITASMFRRKAWLDVGGYKSNIGYEDWEFWINLHEHGHRGRQIPEYLFRYRVDINSRFIDDRSKHRFNMQNIKKLHPNYISIVKNYEDQFMLHEHVIVPDTALINFKQQKIYTKKVHRKRVLVTIPWMTFGGAETLMLNFINTLKSDYDFSFITGIKSSNEWEYKFRQITANIYHLANIFEEEKQKLNFILNYIKTRKVDILHIIHNEFSLYAIPIIRKKHPSVKIIITMFNDSVDYFENVIKASPYVDAITADNNRVIETIINSDYFHSDAELRIIPNGIDTINKFYNDESSRSIARKELKINNEEIAVFYVGRLSPEKNPDKYLESIKIINKTTSNKFRFFMIGDGNLTTQLMHNYREVFKYKNFSYLGYKDNIDYYLRAADIFVLPSDIEGFPLSVLEAMAVGVAPICSSVGALPDIIENDLNGYLVKPGCVDQIVECILKLGNDRRKLKLVKTNARKTVEEKYNLQNLKNNYSALYEGTEK